MDASLNSPRYQLTSELARYCLPQANRDSERIIAWVNSICVLFLLVGVAGARRAPAPPGPPPPLAEAIPVIVEPPPPPPPATTTPRQIEPRDEEKPETPAVVVVTPDSPAINFSVPTIGNLVVPAGVAVAPPLKPMEPVTPLTRSPTRLEATGEGGERPSPDYPELARQHGQQGSVTLLLTVNDSGVVTAAEVRRSSGFALLDRGALEFVKRKWIIPPAGSNRLYETTINFQLKAQ